MNDQEKALVEEVTHGFELTSGRTMSAGKPFEFIRADVKLLVDREKLIGGLDTEFELIRQKSVEETNKTCVALLK